MKTILIYAIIIYMISSMEMGEKAFSHIEEKKSGEYLRQIGENSSEKIAEFVNIINSKDLPRTSDGKIIALEIGVGGGESIKNIDKFIDKEDVEVLGVDIFPELLKAAKRKGDREKIFVGADFGSMPFDKESVSIINASAVFHEASSYGVAKAESGERIYGEDAIKRVFSESNHILKKGGFLTYRDISAPVENGDFKKEVSYNRKSWKEFYIWFMDEFLKSIHVDYYKNENDDIKSNFEDGRMRLKMSKNLHREFQRHYLMFRDYMRINMGKTVGLSVIDSRWYDKERGIKKFTVEIAGSMIDEMSEEKDLLSKFKKISGTENLYEIDSDSLDDVYDGIMYKWLKMANEDPGHCERFVRESNRWKDREISESYIYGNCFKAVLLSVESAIENNQDSVLFPSGAESLKLINRFYYNRYLGRIIDDPENDAKQIINFEKISFKEAKEKAEKMIEDKPDVISGDELNLILNKLKSVEL